MCEDKTSGGMRPACSACRGCDVGQNLCIREASGTDCAAEGIGDLMATSADRSEEAGGLESAAAKTKGER